MSETGRAVRVTVTPTWEGYRDLCLGAMPARVKALPYLTAFAGAAVLATLGTSGDGPFSTMAPLIGGVLLLNAVWLWFALRRGVRRRWDNSPGVREPRAYVFSDGGIRFEGETSSGSMAWSRVRRVRVVAGNVVLFADPPLAHYVPEAELDAGHRATLEELLRMHVPGFAGLPPRG